MGGISESQNTMNPTLLLALALWRGMASAQDSAPSPEVLAAAPVADAVRQALAAEAAMPPPTSVREKLERMGMLDQAGRAHIGKINWAALSPQESIATRRAIAAALEPVDAANIAELRRLLPVTGWFSSRDYGPKAADAAFHILQHSDDTETKKRVLPYLQALAMAGEIDGFDFAAMFDRVATSEGRPQRYGTQFRCVNRKIEPFPLENPAEVERLRAELKLRQSFAESERMQRGKPC